jgi:hypothetical protein
VDYPDLLKLPEEAWDVSAKKVPTGLRMFHLPSEGAESSMTTPPEKSKSPLSPSKIARRESAIKNK